VPALKIITPQYFKLCDEQPKRNDPYRFTRLRIVPNNLAKSLGPKSVTLSGTVKDSGGSGLVGRSIRIFSDQNMTSLLGQTYTTSGGAWSLAVPGASSSPFVAIAQSEQGENSEVFIFPST